MALFRKFFYKKPPDRLLEISERVYVFDCCFSADVMEESEFEGYIKGIMMQTRDHFPDASFMVFNFHEGEKESQMASLLSQYDLIVMDYPFHYEGCPLLKMEMIHHFLRSCESWLSLGQQNFLLMHCEQGGWPTLAFMLAALMIYLKQYTGEKRTLEMVYKQAPHDFIELLSPLNPMPSQLRYLQYVSKSVASEWPLFDRALTLDCVILRMIPQFDMEGGCRPIFRIYGQDPLFLSDQTTKLLYSTPKSSNTVRHYRQADCEVVKIDIHCHIQGDVLLECIHLYEDLEQEQIIFRIMFNTDFIKSNILMLNHDQIDILWDKKSLFPKDFRAEVLLSEIESMTAINTADLVNVEEKEGLPMEAFDMVQEIFSHLEWLDAKDDTTIYKHQQIIPSHNFQEKLENLQNDNKPQLSIFDKQAEMPRYSEVSILSESERSEVKTISSSLLPDTQFPEPTELALSKTHSQTPEPLFSDRSGLSEPLNSSSHTPASPPLSSTTNTHIASFTKLTCTSSQHPPVSQLLLPTSSAQGSVAKPPPLVTVFPPKPVVLSHPSPASMPTLHPENSILQSPRLIPASTMSTFPPHESLVTSSPSPSLVPPKSTFQSPPPLSLPSPPRSTSNSSLAPQSPYPPPPPPLPPALEKSTPQQSFSKLPPIPPPPPPPPPSPLPPALEKSTPQHSFSKLPPIPLPPPPASKTLTSPNELSKTSLQPLLELHRVPSQGSTSSAPLPPLPSFSEASLSHVSPESSQSTSESTSLKPIPSPPSPPQSPALTDAKVTLPPPTKPLNFEPLKVSKSASAAPPLPPPPPPTLPSNQSSSPPVVPPPPPPLVSLGSIESRKQGVPPPPLPDAASIKRSNASSIRGNSLRPAKGPGNSHSTQSRRNLKPLHWVKVTRALQGSLWAEAQKSKESSEVPEIDICELESLFPAVVPNSDAPTGGEKAKRRSSLGGKPDKVHLIDLRRANNCEIMLTKIKMPLPDLMNSLIALDDSVLDVDQLDNLIKFCPTKEEIELLQGYIGDKERLGKCEQFFLELMKVPRVGNKLRVFSYKIQFHTQVADLSNSLNVVNTAANEIRGSVKLKKILQTILSLGNALNQGTARGSAVGFRLDSLLKLTDIRARNNKMTLMHYLCKVLADKLPEVLDFEKDLLNLEVASKIQLKILAEEMQAINEGLEKVEQELTASENDGPVSEIFHKTLKEFLGIAESKIRSLTSLYSAVGRNADALALYFGEDPARCPFEQVISTLFTFTKMFGRAHEENCRQLELDRKKAQRESDKAKIKITVLKNELGNPPSPT